MSDLTILSVARKRAPPSPPKNEVKERCMIFLVCSLALLPCSSDMYVCMCERVKYITKKTKPNGKPTPFNVTSISNLPSTHSPLLSHSVHPPIQTSPVSYPQADTRPYHYHPPSSLPPPLTPLSIQQLFTQSSSKI